jgi:predicted RNA-binding Zn ribbon-like protein
MAARKGKKGKAGKVPDVLRRDGDLSVCFANTSSKKRRGPRDYVDLLLWLEHHGALGPEEAARYRTLAAERPDGADAAFSFAEELRDLLFWIFNEVAARREVSPELTGAFNGCLASLPRRQLVPASEAVLRWGWAEGGEDDLGRPLWGVVISAAALLTSKESRKIRRCADEDCDLLFVAKNAGSPRRWCCMKSCGMRAKSQRHYHRKVKPRRLSWRRLSRAEQERRLADIHRWLAGKGRAPQSSPLSTES